MNNSFVKTLVGSLGLLACLLAFGQANAQQQEPHNADLPKKEANMEPDKKILVEGGFKKILSDLLPLESIESIEAWFDEIKYRDETPGRDVSFDFNKSVKHIKNVGTYSFYKKEHFNLIFGNIAEWEINKSITSGTDAEDFYIMIKIKSKTTTFEMFVIKYPYSDIIQPQSVPFFIKTATNKTNMYEKYIIEMNEGTFLINLPFSPLFK